MTKSQIFKALRREKYNKESTAQMILRGKQLLTQRPADLPYEIYKAQRKHESDLVRVLFANRPNPTLQQLMADGRPLVKMMVQQLRKKKRDVEKG